MAQIRQAVEQDECRESKDAVFHGAENGSPAKDPATFSSQEVKGILVEC
jgi:hypothetical protein